MIRRRAALAATLAWPALARAQDLPPDRPIRIILGAGAGGITDILARIVAARLQARLDRPVVVDNRPGAGGIIATEAVVRARPDGTTLLMVTHSPETAAMADRRMVLTQRGLAAAD
jgi:tripartite-type tricarboxylate transporter receptor subunit TctC